MSVIRSKRHQSVREFEYNYSCFYERGKLFLDKVPERRKPYVAVKLSKQMNIVYNDIMNITILLYAKGDDERAEKQRRIRKALKDIKALEKPMFVLFNVLMVEFKKECFWCDMLNREIALLNGMLTDENDALNERISVIDWKAVNRMELLRNVSEFHRYTHGKVVRAVGQLENADSPLLITLIDDILYLTMGANIIFPETKEDYLQRIAMLETVLDELKKIQRPMLAFFNLMQYSDNTQEEWSAYLSKQIRLTEGVIESDKKRLKRLK